MKRHYFYYALIVIATMISSCEKDEIIIEPKPVPPSPTPPEPKPIELNIKDPLYPQQWYLKNTGQDGGIKGIDIGVESVWKLGYSGKGINIAMIDGNINLNKNEAHEDLKDNINFDKSYNWDESNGSHGTNVAGIMVAKDNKLGVRGVAFGSKLYAYGFDLAGVSDNAQIRAAITKNIKEIAVMNNSWGVAIFDKPAYRDAWEQGLRTGFNGKGTVYVHGNGNQPRVNMSASTTGNFYGLVNVNSMNNKGNHTGMFLWSTSYSFGYSIASNIWVTAPGDKMMTTDMYDRRDKKYEENFSMTSSAAPVVSGIVALIREANPSLTWRDVKLILAETTTKNDPSHSDWQKIANTKSGNAIYFNHEYGFGLVNAFKAVQLAKTWTLLPAMKTKESSNSIPDLEITSTLKSDDLIISDVGGGGINFIETVNVIINLEKKNPSENGTRKFQLELHHNGIKSELYREGQAMDFSSDRSGIPNSVNKSNVSLNMLTNAHFGQTARGTWTLKVKDDKAFTKVKDWKLVIRGH